MKKYLDFSQEFGKVDEELIAEAGKPWTTNGRRLRIEYN